MNSNSRAFAICLEALDELREIRGSYLASEIPEIVEPWRAPTAGACPFRPVTVSSTTIPSPPGRPLPSSTTQGRLAVCICILLVELGILGAGGL